MEIIGAQNLKKIEELVNANVEAQTDKIIADAEAECEKIRASSDSDELGNALDIISVEQRKIAEKYKSIVAKNLRDNRKKCLLARKAFTDDLFEDIAARLTKFADSPEYGEYLKKLTENEPQGFVVLLSEKDMRFSDLFCEQCRATPDISLGGIMLLYEQSGFITDKSFDSALAEQKAVFGERFGHLISGGSM